MTELQTQLLERIALLPVFTGAEREWLLDFVARHPEEEVLREVVAMIEELEQQAGVAVATLMKRYTRVAKNAQRTMMQELEQHMHQGESKEMETLLSDITAEDAR